MGWFRKIFGGSQAPAPVAEERGIDAFARQCEAAILRRLPGARTTLILDPQEANPRIAWRLPDGRDGALLLNRFWQRLQAGESPADVLSSAESTLMRVEDSEQRQALDVDAILPLFQPYGWQDRMRENLSAMLGEAPDPSDLPLARPTGLDAVVLTYVQDRGDTMGHLSQRQCAVAGLDVDALHAHALRNLARLCLPRLELDGGNGRYVARVDGHYDVSMMLLFDQWRDRLNLDGDPVVAIPARNEVLICGADDVAGVEQMAGMAVATVGERPDALTPELIVWRSGLLDPTG